MYLWVPVIAILYRIESIRMGIIINVGSFFFKKCKDWKMEHTVVPLIYGEYVLRPPLMPETVDSAEDYLYYICFLYIHG